MYHRKLWPGIKLRAGGYRADEPSSDDESAEMAVSDTPDHGSFVENDLTDVKVRLAHDTLLR